MQKRILLADDDLSIRQLLGRILVSEHYEVVVAKTGRQAAELCLMAQPPDLALLDLNMPDKDGWEAFCLMKATQPSLPVIVLTARPHQFEKAVEMGVDALMEKPLDLPLLLATIRDFLAGPEFEGARSLKSHGGKTVFLSRSVEMFSKDKC